MILEYFSCLITTTRHIEIEDILFWDWEDDELTNNYTFKKSIEKYL